MISPHSTIRLLTDIGILSGVSAATVALLPSSGLCASLSSSHSDGAVPFHYAIFMPIRNNSSFRLKHPGVPEGSDGSDATLYPVTENQTRPVAEATGRVAYLPCSGYHTILLILATRRIVYYARRSGVRLTLLCIRNVVTYTHYRNDTYVTLFAGVAVMQ